MTGKLLLLAAVVVVCDASVIPISGNWPSSAVCSRACRRTSSGVGCLDPCSSGLDYNYLFSLLYPGLAFDPLDESAVSMLESYPCAGSGMCDMNGYYRALCSEGGCLKGCDRYGCSGRERCGCDRCRGCSECMSECCKECSCYPKCMRCCSSGSGCYGCYGCGSRACSRCSSYKCKKSGQCYSCPMTYA